MKPDLSEFAERLGVFLDTAPLSMHLIGVDGRIVRANAPMAKALGSTPEALEGARVAEHLAPASPATLFESVWDRLPDSGTLRFDVHWATATDSVLTGEEHLVGVYDEEGACLGAVGIFVEGRTDAGEAQRATEGRYRDIFENSMDSICILDVDRNYVDVNRATEVMTGYSRAELLRMNISDMRHPDDEEQSERHFEALDRWGAYEAYQGRILTKSGETRYIEVNSNVIVRDGRVVGSRDIIRDVTDRVLAEEARRTLEQQLFVAQKMETVGRLAGGIAHDFNNILTSVMGYAELLMESFPDPDSPDGEAALAILKGAERASHLTRQLLGFARRTKYEPQPVDLNETIREVVQMSANIFQRQIEVRYDLAADLPRVLGERSQLDQVLSNLIINARDAMPRGGTLSLATEAVLIDSETAGMRPPLESGVYVEVSVRDDGTGMDEATVAHIFEPFFSTKEGEGTGLGLATVYGIVSNHKGLIEVESAPGEGTSFRVLLPATGEAVPDRVPDGDAVRGSGLILVIDDEPAVRNIISRQLRSLGYAVVQAEDGMEGLERYREHLDSIDLVLIDMVMPRMDGRATYEAIRILNPSAKTILVSGYSPEEQASPMLDDDDTGFIQKPFRLSELSAKVADALAP